jgi:hypothetical protein
MPNLIEVLANVLNKREGKRKHPGNRTRGNPDPEPFYSDKGRSLKQWIKLLTARQDSILEVMKRGGKGNSSLEDFLGRSPVTSTSEKGLLSYGEGLLKMGEKIDDDPGWADDVVTAEKVAAKQRKQAGAFRQVQKTFFNPKASRGSAPARDNLIYS